MSGQIRTNLGRDRASSQRHCNEYEAAIDTSPVPWNLKAKADFKVTLKRLQKDIKMIDDSFDQWETYIDSLDAEDQPAERRLFNEWKDKEEYIQLQDDLEKYILQIEEYLQIPWSATTVTRTPSIAASSDDEEERQPTPINLSALNIPKFNGDYAEWTTFWEMFDQFVHKRKYPAISKFAALRSLLEGRALAEIQGFSTTAANYPTVVQTLKERFGNEQFVIRELELKLDSIQQAKPTPSSIGATVTAVTNICRQLKNLGIDTNNNATKNTVIKKMPPRQQIELQELLFDKPTTSIDDILHMMKKMEIKAEIAASVNQQSHANTPSSSMSPKKPAFNRSNGNWRNQNESSKTFKRTLPCSFCGGDHHSVTCQTYSSTTERIQQLNRQKKCIQCMGNDHLADRCMKKDLKCKQCYGPHYSFLCTKTANQRNTKAMLSLNRTQSSLLTKTCTVSNFDCSSQQATLFFDSGSQRSYVTNNLVKALNLPKVNRETLSVEGFAGKVSIYNSDLVKLRVKTVDGFKEIFANSTKKIADYIPTIKKEDINKYSRSVEVPDVLIGMDYFCNFVTSSKEVDDGIFEVDSIVGKMYTGKVPLNDQQTISSLALDPPMQNIPGECETFWKLESMGIVDSGVTNQEDKVEKEGIMPTQRRKVRNVEQRRKMKLHNPKDDIPDCDTLRNKFRLLPEDGEPLPMIDPLETRISLTDATANGADTNNNSNDNESKSFKSCISSSPSDHGYSTKYGDYNSTSPAMPTTSPGRTTTLSRARSGKRRHRSGKHRRRRHSSSSEKPSFLLTFAKTLMENLGQAITEFFMFLFSLLKADFIYPSINLTMHHNEYSDKYSDPSYIPSNAAGGERLVEKYFNSLQLIDSFWKRRSQDYLNFLRERHNDQHKNARGAAHRAPTLGEYVFVSEADQPRGCWKIAKIVDCIQSNDKEIRSVEIEYLNGFKTRRAINHLYPLEEGAVNLNISDNNYPFIDSEHL